MNLRNEGNASEKNFLPCNSPAAAEWLLIPLLENTAASSETLPAKETGSQFFSYKSTEIKVDVTSLEWK